MTKSKSQETNPSAQQDAINRLVQREKTVKVDGVKLTIYAPSFKDLSYFYSLTKEITKYQEEGDHDKFFENTIKMASHMYMKLLKIDDEELAGQLFFKTGCQDSDLFRACLEAMGLQIPNSILKGGAIDKDFLSQEQQE